MAICGTMIARTSLLLCIVAALTTAGYANICDSRPDGEHLPHENCSKFYQCSNGEPIVHQCSGILVFNPDKQVCDYPENVQCSSDVASLALPDPAATCAAEGSHGKLVPHANCNQFYECSFGHAFAFECPPGLLFNTVSERCEWADLVDCGERVLPS